MASVCTSEYNKESMFRSMTNGTPPVAPTSLSGSSGIKCLWDSRLRTRRSASLNSISCNEENVTVNTAETQRHTPSPSATIMSSTPRRSTEERTVSVKQTTPPSTGAASSSSSNGGLTESPSARARASSLVHFRSTSHHSSTRRRGSVASSRSTSPEDEESTAPKSRRLSRHSSSPAVHNDPVVKPLFRNSLLQDFEPHEARPALTVVFDLDETLVSNRNHNLPQAVLRPYCLHVLNALRHMKNLEIVLWTASTKETASGVVEQLHESGAIFDDVIFRSDLWFTEPVHTKDLRLLGRDMDRVVIIDNAANCCKLNRTNAILIEDFHGFRHEEDAALVNVYYMVESLLKMAKEGVPVREGLQRLVAEGHLCRSVVFGLPETWKFLPLAEIPPLKLPPIGRFVKSNTTPPSRSIMKYWSY